MDWPIPADALPRSTESADRPAGDAFAKRGASERLGIIARPENAAARPPRQTSLPARRAAILLGIAGVGVLLHGSVARFQFGDAGPAQRNIARATGSGATAIDLPPPDLLRPLSPDEAAKENAARPFVGRPDTQASKFVLHTDDEDRARAVACLTQAVYYEAAGEGPDGGRAVAQIVLNRLRHPGYPASICGVVYQGSDRTSGCQFTFACDGSLLRVPIASLWARSRKIAEEALAGKVFAPIGHATHYHADYVLPYWADSLDKTVQIGRHIFYRLRSTLGDSRSFFQRYAGIEPQLLPQPADALALSPVAATGELASALLSDAVKGSTAEVEKAAPVASPLAADAAPATLIADAEGAPVPSKKKSRPSGDCAPGSERRQILPFGANDVRANASSSTC
jgi:spore germination cell wall hydrolase CwlJ-like protein